MKKCWLWLGLSFLPLLLGSCHYSKRIPKTTILTGEIINRHAKTPSAVKILFTDPVFEKTQVYMLDSLGRFEAKADLLFSQNHTLQYGNESINFYASPGDSIHIAIDASKFNRRHNGVTFSGDHGSFNNAFDPCYLHMNALLQIPDAETLSLPADSLCTHMEQAIARLTDSLNAYAFTQHLPKELVRHMEIDLTYTVARLYADYKKEDSSPAARKERFRMFSCPMFDPDNIKLFESMSYPSYLIHYSQSLIESQLPDAVLEGPRLNYLKNAAELIASHEPASLCRDYMLYALIWSLHQEPGLEDLMPELTFMFTNAYIADHLSARVRQAREIANTPPKSTPLNSLTYLKNQKQPESLPGEDFFEHLRTTYPDKVIYIVLYTTGSNDCREMLLQSGPLYRHYQGQEVVFVNLCMDSEYNEWKPTVRRLGINGENYFVNMAESELVHQICRTEEYPAFLLMNRQGEIVNTQAAAPSSLEEITRQIDDLLAQTAESDEPSSES